MRTVMREEIVDYVTYSEKRDAILEDVLLAKNSRRIHLGEHLTFLFENHETIRYQVQEMMRIERIVKESDILHELDTYNELLGKNGQLGCTLLIEIETPEERDVKLSAWLDLPKHLYLKLADGTHVPAIFDDRQVGETRLSSVQYLKFDTSGEAPVAIGCDLEDYNHEVELSLVQRSALSEDLES